MRPRRKAVRGQRVIDCMSAGARAWYTISPEILVFRTLWGSSSPDHAPLADVLTQPGDAQAHGEHRCRLRPCLRVRPGQEPKAFQFGYVNSNAWRGRTAKVESRRMREYRRPGVERDSRPRGRRQLAAVRREFRGACGVRLEGRGRRPVLLCEVAHCSAKSLRSTRWPGGNPEYRS